MRAGLSCHPLAERKLQLGEGKAPVDDNGMILCSTIGTTVSSPEELVNKVFPDIPSDIRHHDWLRERAILAPRNAINHLLLEQIDRTSETNKAINTVADESNAVN